MSDFLSGLQQQLKERITSPLSGAFVISWIIINYKLILIIFSDVKPWVKFGYITNHFYPDYWHLFGWGFAAPLLFASLYILLYPFPARWAMSYSLWQKKKTLDAKHKGEGIIPITREEADAELAPLKLKINELQDLLERRENIIDRLKSNLDRVETSEADSIQQLKKAEQSRQELAAEVGTLQQAITNNNETIDELTADRDNLIDQLETYTSGKEAELEHLKQELFELDNELQYFKANLPPLDKNKLKELLSALTAQEISNSTSAAESKPFNSQVSASKHFSKLNIGKKEPQQGFDVFDKARNSMDNKSGAEPKDTVIGAIRDRFKPNPY